MGELAIETKPLFVLIFLHIIFIGEALFSPRFVLSPRIHKQNPLMCTLNEKYKVKIYFMDVLRLQQCTWMFCGQYITAALLPIRAKLVNWCFKDLIFKHKLVALKINI